jgi:hypothetical protein
MLSNLTFMVLASSLLMLKSACGVGIGGMGPSTGGSSGVKIGAAAPPALFFGGIVD